MAEAEDLLPLQVLGDKHLTCCLGFSLGVSVFDLFDQAVLLHGLPQGVHLLVLLGNIDE